MEKSFDLTLEEDDDDDDFDYYSNPIAQYQKVKDQYERKKNEQMELLEKAFNDSIEEENMETSNTDSSTKDSQISEQKNDSQGKNEILVISDESRSPKRPEIENDFPSNRRLTRSATRRGGRRIVKQINLAESIYKSTPKRKSRGKRTDVDNALEKLDKIAHKLKAAKNIDVIEISNSPILIESEGEEDDYNDEVVNVKVIWRHSAPHRFPIVRKKDISSIYEFFAKLENLTVQNILLTKGDNILSPMSTPLSMEYKVTDILEGGVLTDDNLMTEEITKKKNKDCIEVKVQQKNVKRPLLIELHKSNDMTILAKKVSTELNLHVDKLKFIFDGEPLDLEESVQSLDLEGGECFDLVIKS